MTACVSRTRSATSHIGPGPPRGWAAIGDGSARAAPGTRHGRRQHGSGARFGSRPPCRIELPGSRSRERRQERCGRSAVGSASPCQGEGRGFESRRPLGRGPGNKHLRILRRWDGREARQRPAKPCTRVRIPFPPLSVPPTARAISSAGERFPDTEEVTGSIPVSPTTSDLRKQVRTSAYVPKMPSCLALTPSGPGRSCTQVPQPGGTRGSWCGLPGTGQHHRRRGAGRSG